MKKCISILLLLCVLVCSLQVSVALGEGEKIFSGHTIVYTGTGDSTEQAATQAVIDKFMEDTGCEVKTIFIGDSYDTKITAMIAANETIDIGQMESGTIAYKLAEQGKFEPLDSYLEADGISLDNYVGGAYYYDNDGNIISYSGAIELMQMFYCKDAFDEAGLSYPPADPDEAWTWDEFVDTAMKLTKDANGKTPYDEGFDADNIVRYGVNMGIWWPIWGSFVLSNGGSLVDDNGNFALNQPAAVEAIQKLADLSLVNHCMPNTVQQEGMPGSDVALLTGAYAMVIDGQWLALQLSESGVDFEVGAMPKMGEKCVSVCTNSMTVIMADSTEKEVAWALLKYMNDPSTNITLFENGNLMPAEKKWLTEEAYLNQWAAAGNPARPATYSGIIKMLLNNAVPPLTADIIGFPDMIDIVNTEMDEVMYGNKTAQQGMDDAAASIEAAGIVLGTRGK